MKIPALELKDTGVIREIKKGIVKVRGLASCVNGQLVELAQDLYGLVIGFSREDILVLVLGDETVLEMGGVVYGEEGSFNVPVGNDFIGRTINSFGYTIDGKGKVAESDFYPIFRDAPGVMDRIPIDTPLLTGIKIIDTVIPLGKGQRELILGDRTSGKTTIAVDTILNQKGKNVVCIFCWIGGSTSAFTKVMQELKRAGAMEYTTVVGVMASSSPGEQYLAPYTACTLGEYFMDHGRDVLVVYDNLSRHAWAHRQLSLLLERPPGREAYPGDIFYIHSQLVERAARLSTEKGGGSMTFLPIAETQEGDVTSLIASNLISMTDGQIYLDTSLFNEGFKPAIDLGLSVSRIGSKVQCEAIKDVARELKIEYARYKELVSLTRVRTKLSPEVEERLKRGEALSDLFIQDKNSPLELAAIIILFYAFKSRLSEILDKEKREKFKDGIYAYLLKEEPHLVERIGSDKILTDDTKKRLDKAFKDFFSKS